MSTARRVALVLGSTVVLVVVLTWAVLALDADGVLFSFLVVWLPMVWLGIVSRVVVPRLPRWWYPLRGFELDGRCYELVGVRLFKRLLRRGPLAAFNPDLHLPPERTPERLAHLDQRMRDAESSHGILVVVTLGVAAFQAAVGRWASAGWIVGFNLLLNGYPVMLQRYNRALLAARFGPSGADQPHR
jgi:hypothetical protein